LLHCFEENIGVIEFLLEGPNRVISAYELSLVLRLVLIVRGLERSVPLRGLLDQRLQGLDGLLQLLALLLSVGGLS
jgi:hypothetical protein